MQAADELPLDGGARLGPNGCRGTSRGEENSCLAPAQPERVASGLDGHSAEAVGLPL